MWRTWVYSVAGVLLATQLCAGVGCRRQPPSEPTVPDTPVSAMDELPVVNIDTPVAILKGHNSLIYGVAFSPDGKTLASGCEDSDGIKLWDVATGQVKDRLKEKTGFILSVQFHPDGNILASTSGWDAAFVSGILARKPSL